jgi:rRNA maturation RNase YbeY
VLPREVFMGNFSETFALKSSAKRVPQLPYSEIKDAVLGKQYEVSLVFVGRTRARALNRAYRKNTYVPNVLAFPLAAKVGEIFMCTERLGVEAKQHNMSVRTFAAYLFIHALLHLKGHAHGDTMEAQEAKYLKRFGFI